MLSAPGPRSVGSSRRPGQIPAAQHVGVHMEDRLPRRGPGVEDDTVAAGSDSLGPCHLVGLGGNLGQQAAVRSGQRGQVGVVVPGDDQDVGRGLRVDVPERDCPASFGHQLGRDVTRHDLAEEAVGHAPDLSLWMALRARSTLLI